MTQTQHTPGPWNIDEPDSFEGHTFIPIRAHEGSEAYRYICEVQPNKENNMRHSSLCGEDHANARLIAAAPDLLEALSAVTEFIERQFGDKFTWRDGSVEQCSAAIAKARGQ